MLFLSFGMQVAFYTCRVGKYDGTATVQSQSALDMIHYFQDIFKEKRGQNKWEDF